MDVFDRKSTFNSQDSRLTGLKDIIKFVIGELKPRGKWLTPFNIISIPIILIGMFGLFLHFTKLGHADNLSQLTPWGLYIGFNVVTGVPFAAGAYIITMIVYVLNVDKYHSLVKETVLYGFLAYFFYGIALQIDVGRPWNMGNPIIGNNFGYASVLFLVAWHFFLYMAAQLVEFSPVIATWLKLKKARKFLKSLTVGAVIFGIVLSILHQSGLGALFLMAKSKVHPLWYSEFLPVLFLVSSIPAGLSMVILLSTINRKVFKEQMEHAMSIHPHYEAPHDVLVIGLAKGASMSLFVYYFFKALVFIHGHHWALMTDFYGVWYFIEVMGFVLLPCIMFARGVQLKSLGLIRVASVVTLLGIIMNRLNVGIITFNWNLPEEHYVPAFLEICISLSFILIQLWIYRWAMTRMPVLGEED